MKLSESTMSVLKNFSQINHGMVFKKGNVIRTVSKEQNILAQAKIEDSFDETFVIYDLNRLLSVLSIMNSPDIKINIDNKSLEIDDERARVLYRLSDEIMVVSPPEDELDIEDAEVKFTLTNDTLSQVMKLGGVLGLPNIVIRGDRNKISIAAIDVKNEDSDVFWIDVGETTAEFQSIFRYDSLKIIPGTYDVSITTEGISYFVNANETLQYWIATEAGSTYSE